MATLGKSRISELRVGTGQQSTMPTNGALIVEGGAGVQDDLNVGGNLTAGNIEDVLSSSDEKIPSSKAVYDGTISNITADAEKVGANDPVTVEVTKEGRTTNLHFEIPAGETASMLSLVSDTYVFPCDYTGCPKPNTYTVTAVRQNLTEATSWTLSNEKSYTSVESIEIHTDDIVSNVGSNLAITDGTTGDEEYKWGSSTSSNSTVNFKTTNLPLGKVYRLRAWCTVTANDNLAGKVYVGYTGFNDSETHWDSVYSGMAVGSSQFFSVTMYAESKATADPHFMLYAENCTLDIYPTYTEFYEAKPETLEITATAGAFSDKISIVPVIDGLVGETPYFMVLSTYNVSFLANEDGTVQDGQFGEIATLKIFHGNDGEDLSEWSLSGYVSSGSVSTPVVSADGRITITSLDSDVAIITIQGTKGDILVDQSLRLSKVKSGTSPYLLALENDSYIFTVSGNQISDTFPHAVSGIRILRGNEEQSFTIGTGSGWVLNAVFTAVINDSSSSTDGTLFNGDILADGTIRVTVLNPSIQYGEIAITASNSALSQSLSTMVSIRLQKGAGFGTPTASATTLETGMDATVAVSASGENDSKVFSFQFGIPRGEPPVFISLNPDTVPVPCSSSGAVLPSAFPLHTSIITYKGTEDVTSQWSYSINWSSSTATGTVDSQGNVTITDYADIESTILTITATRIGSSPAETIEKGLLLYKARTVQGTAGAPGANGANAIISGLTATLQGNTSNGDPSITATSSPVSGQPNTYTFSFIFNNLILMLYNELNTSINGAVTPNAVRTALSQIGFSRAVYYQAVQPNATLSAYVVPNYTAGQEIDVYYNGLRLIEGTAENGGSFTFDTTSGTITFNTPLGGNSLEQQLIVIARTLSSGGN